MNHDTRHDDPISTDLSPAARERKATMLANLQGELRARRTRRTLARGGTVAALLLATATLVWIIRLPLQEGGGRGVGSAFKPLPEGGVGVGSMASTPTADGQSRTTPSARPETPKIIITQIQTDPTILDRLAIKPTLARIEQIGDDELLHAMQEAGRPAGLIRANGTLTVVDQSPQAPVGG